MSRRLRWTEQAVDQLGAIAEYLSRSSPVYAEQIVQGIATRLEQAREFPESGGLVSEVSLPEVRQLIEWPHRIIYRPQQDAIEVLAIVHVRRDMRQINLR